MLNCYLIDNSDQKPELFRSILTESPLWIVDDLQAKFWMQEFLRKEDSSLICSDDVLRASEFWQKQLIAIDPMWKPLSPHISQYLIEKWMKEIIAEQNLPVNGKDFQRAYQTIGQILPLLCHSHGEEALTEWFLEKEEAKERWYHWYLLGQSLWRRFSEQKVIPLEWMKGILLNLESDWRESRPIVFDLSLELDDIESDLILELSRFNDVHVVVPKFYQDKECYQMLLSRCMPQEMNSPEILKEKVFKKLPSMLSEIKECVGQIRLWLEEGVPKESIAVVSPQIENYWPTLHEHFLVEGVPVSKNSVTPLSQFPAVQIWLSKLRLSLKEIQSGDGENLIFSSQESPQFDFSQFQTLFSNIYDVSDYKRNDWVGDVLPVEARAEESLSLPEFLQWSFPFFSHKSRDLYEEIVSSLDEVFFLDEKLTREQWVDFFENLFSRSEKNLYEGVDRGITVTSLLGAQNQKFEKIVILGLNEKNTLENFNTSLHWTDIESIKMNFGFNLPHTDRLIILDRLVWLEKKEVSEILYCYSETDFLGQFQAPSFFWIEGAIGEKHSLELESPLQTRWDELMNLSPDMESHFPENSNDQRLTRVKQDLGQEPVPLLPYDYFSLSASSIGEFFKCPFRFFAQKGLRLYSLPELDLDIDYLTRGRLMHKVCELIVNDKKWELSEEEISQLLDKSREEIKMEVYNDAIWEFLKPFYIKNTIDFLNSEKTWRQEYPNTETYRTEEFLETKLSVKEGKIVWGLSDGVPFRGVIDRIDKNDQDQYAILDYKSSSGSLTQYSSWVKKGNLQLLLYVMALEAGVLDEEEKKVVGTFYYVLKDMSRSLGFATVDASPDFLPSKKMTEADKLELLESAQEILVRIIKDLSQGRIEPLPEDEKHCEKCDWKKLCRNPSLNI